jgi:hypothetical protein
MLIIGLEIKKYPQEHYLKATKNEHQSINSP